MLFPESGPTEGTEPTLRPGAPQGQEQGPGFLCSSSPDSLRSPSDWVALGGFGLGRRSGKTQ